MTKAVDAIRGHDRFVLTTHENPDGDALGSLLAMQLGLVQLGKDTVMVLHGDAPLPVEYGFMSLDQLRRRWPDDVAERVLVALDCANESRIADPEVLGRVPLSSTSITITTTRASGASTSSSRTRPRPARSSVTS